MNHFIAKVLYITKGNHKSLLQMLFLFMLISGLEVFGTGIISPFITIAVNPDAIQNIYWLDVIYNQLHLNSQRQFLIFLGCFVIIAFYLKAFLAFNAQKTVFKFSSDLKRELSCKLLKAYIEAPYSYHLQINSATLIQNLINTTDAVSIGVVSTFLTLISNTVIVIALMLLLIKTNAIALIIITALLFIAFGLLYPIKDRLARWSKEGFHAYGEMIRITNHGLGSLKETRVIGCESYFEYQMEQQSRIYAKSTTLTSIQMAQLSEVVDQLPEGVKTIIGERGVLLSGGQRQRIGIARVLYHEREILVFDEATAALDTETEHLITQATKALAGNKTIIIIAHRLSTIEHCDCIYQLEKGRIIKSGSYQEVITKR